MVVLRIRALEKSFTLHLQGGVVIPVFSGADLDLAAGECAVLAGASGLGKSTLLRLIYGNYKPLGGEIQIRHQGRPVDLASACPRQVLAVRTHTLGYVSQFLRCVPRVGAVDVVAEPLVAAGLAMDEARSRARALLSRLNIDQRLFELPPATFSGGEQQRVNLARGFINDYPVLLLDEPTASLDAANREVVVELISEAKARGAALLGIFHDQDVRRAVADRVIDIETLRCAA